ncbi:MAG TPA: pilus assembly protein PilM, partial [Tepidisphaeraceae bacterium]
MRWFGHNARSPIGIDIGSRHIKAVQLRRTGREGLGWTVAAAATLPRSEANAPLDAREARRLFDVLERQGFRGNKIVALVPAEKLASSILELPPRTAGAPLDEIARMEFARIHKLDPHSFEMSYWDLPSPVRASKTTYAMAVGCEYKHANAYLDLLESAGFDVLAMDAPATAIARACAPALAPAPGITAALDLGWSGAILVVVLQGTVVYERTLMDSGMRTLHEGIHKQFELSDEVVEYLLREVGMGGAMCSLQAPLGGQGGQEGTKAHRHEANAPSSLRASVPSSAVPFSGYSTAMLRDLTESITGHFAEAMKELKLSFSYADRQYPGHDVARLLLLGGGAQIPGLAEWMAGEMAVEVRAVDGNSILDSGALLAPRILDSNTESKT